MDVRIRSATADDRQFLLALNREVYAELAARIFGSWDEAAQQARFEAKLSKLEFLIVELDGQSIGAAAVTEHADCLYGEEILLRPAFQNRGIGSFLLRRALQVAALRGKSFRLHTSLLSDARRLYERLGFVETSRDEKVVHYERRERLELATPRLLLRPMTVEDSELWYRAIWSDDEVTRHLPSRKAVAPEVMPGFVGRMAQHWQEHGFGVWAVIDRRSGELVGHAGLVRNTPDEIELVYALARSVWGRGFATEAARCLADYAFERLGLCRLVALVFPENAPSAHVLDKIGFLRDGETERFGAKLLRYVRVP